MKKRRSVFFATDVKEYRKYISSPLFESARPINDQCVQINSFKPSITLNKPIAIGEKLQVVVER